MAIQVKNKSSLILSCALLSSAVLISSGCSDKGADEVAEQGGSSVQSTMDVKQPSASEAPKATLESTAPESVEKAVEEIEAVVETKVEEVVEVEVEAVKKEVAKVVEQAPVAAVDGAKIYATCAGCHGSKADGGVGPRLNNQTVDVLVDKLNRYKAGEQLGAMTGMMAPMAAGLSDAEIQAVSNYAVTLK